MDIVANDNQQPCAGEQPSVDDIPEFGDGIGLQEELISLPEMPLYSYPNDD